MVLFLVAVEDLQEQQVNSSSTTTTAAVTNYLPFGRPSNRIRILHQGNSRLLFFLLKEEVALLNLLVNVLLSLSLVAKWSSASPASPYVG